ncbi:hypothetical protein ACTFIY_002317 [Dictyostelium cf. discoideum]
MINNCNYLSTDYNEQAGCIPIRIKKLEGSTSSLITLEDVQIMLVTSGTSGINWVFPKGSIKKSESSKQAAKRETFEEAGIKGKILHQLPKITLADHNKGVNITYYPLFVGKKKNTKKDWMEQSKRTRKWFRLSNVLSFIVPIKPHIEAAIIHIQRSIVTLQQQLNSQFDLINKPIENFPLDEITEFKKKNKDLNGNNSSSGSSGSESEPISNNIPIINNETSPVSQ